MHRRISETVDSGRLQRLIENNQRLNARARIAENAVRHLAETRQSQKSVTKTHVTELESQIANLSREIEPQSGGLLHQRDSAVDLRHRLMHLLETS